ncbi:TPA: glycosyltransferase [Photobacterium damselae]
MLFSVVLCVHEDNPFLDKAINSILEQEYDNDFEFIIVANNCTDELFLKLEQYKDERIRLFRSKIGQLAYNLNYAIDKSRGEYIVRMDSDDIALPSRLRICEKYIGYDVIACSANIINEKDKIISERILKGINISKDLIYKNPIIHPASAIKKSTILKQRGYLGGFQSEDYDLWLRLNKAKASFIFVPEKVLNYRISEVQSKGSLLPYCEVSSYFWREFLLTLKSQYFLGWCLSIAKRLKFKK